MAKPKIVNGDNIQQILLELLDYPFWPKDLDPNETYRVQTDDTDGKAEYGWLTVRFSCDSDIWISQSVCTQGVPDKIRFRTAFGGGHHLRVRNAIYILALAMKFDMEGEGNEPYHTSDDDIEEE